MSKAGDQTQTEIVLGVPEGEPGTTEANIALTTLADRYERRRVIGRGGIGVVYEAYDRKDRTLVALKTIERVSAESLYRFKLEFRALADVQHRNLVRLGELSCEGAEWFFTMELVPGPDVVEHVRGTDREGAPPVEGHVARLRAVLSQLVAAIATVHEAGRVHRDIKPSNVLVTDAGRVVVLDFGLVASRAGLARADEGIVGTPAFMAPEQVTGSAVGPESDWYALGAVLYAALTGHPPFEGPWQQILEAKLDRAPPHPRDVDPAVPADLDELCMELLAREPTGRPRLVSIAARVGLAPGEVDALAFASTDDATLPFVGRAAELAALREAFEQVVGGQGRVVVVAGEPGIGKSALLRSFLTEVGSSALVLSGRCYEQETVPFKGVDAIIDALAENLLARGEVEVAGILGTTGARYLAAIFPTLNRVPLVAADSAVARPLVAAAALREQAFVELERLLGAIAAAQPLVLHLEDLQWADKDSFALLARALEGATGASCLFVGTLRGDAPLPPEAASLLARAERIALHALSDEESRELLATLRWSRQGDEEDPEPLVREGRGHPLFLAELARARRSGPAVPGGHGTLEEVLWRRVQDRDEVDRRFLEMTAIAGAPTPYAVIARAAGTDVGEAQTRLGSLRAAQLIRVSRRGGERYVEPYHERIRESVLERVRRRDEPGGIARRRLELGRALLAATSPEALRERVLSIVQNMNAAIDLITDRGERRRLAELELVAAREALRATAFEQARGYAKVGLELAGDSGWDDEYALTRDLYGVRMAAEAFGGDAAASRASFEEARAHAATTVDRTATVVDWMELQTSQGALLEAVRTGREELAALGVKLPQRATRRMVLAFLLQVRVLRGKRSIEELLYLPKLEGDPVHEGAMRVLVALAPAAYMLDANLRSLIHLLNVKLTLLYGASDVSAYGFSGYGSILSAVFGKVVQGESLGRLSLDLNERFENRKLAARLQFLYGGWHASWVRPYAEAKEALRRSFTLARQNGDVAFEAYAATLSSIVTFCESSSVADVYETGTWARDVALSRGVREMAAVADAHARYGSALRTGDADLSLPGSSDGDFFASLNPRTPTGAAYYFFCRAELAYLHEDLPRAAEYLEEARKRSNVIEGHPTNVELCLLETVIGARVAVALPAPERSIAALGLNGNLRRLRGWAANCPSNFAAHHLLGEAEAARARGAAGDAVLYAGRAVTAARVHRSPKREALALELSARLARDEGNVAHARELRAEAAQAYRRWGAEAKARALEAEG